MTFSLFRGRWGVRLLVIFGLLLALFVVQKGFFNSSSTGSPSLLSAPSPAELRQSWRSGVQTILRQYNDDQNATRAREALLGLNVAREDQSTHLGLVLAFNALSEQQPGAQDLFVKARKDFEGN